MKGERSAEVSDAVENRRLPENQGIAPNKESIATKNNTALLQKKEKKMDSRRKVGVKRQVPSHFEKQKTKNLRKDVPEGYSPSLRRTATQ